MKQLTKTTKRNIEQSNRIKVKVNTYVDYDVEHNNKDIKFKIGYHVRIPKHKSISAKGYTPN